MEEVARDSRGNQLYIKPNEAGGNIYWSDEIGGGVMVWDTSLVSPEMLCLALGDAFKSTIPDECEISIRHVKVHVDSAVAAKKYGDMGQYAHDIDLSIAILLRLIEGILADG